MAAPSPLIPIILCGGAGTRLWPVSRKSSPKQFAPLLGQASLLQETAMRVQADGFAAPMIVTAEPFRFMVSEQLDAVGMAASDILIEPEARNTAPAVLAAALRCAAQDPNALMLVMPSDHQIPDAAAFREAVAAAVPAARAGRLVTFGVSPSRPETGYGYLELPDKITDVAAAPLPLRSFVEKPDRARAEAMLAEGRYLWNAGIFLFSAPAILKAYATHAPAMLAAVKASLAAAQADLGFIRLDAKAWQNADNLSIDYAIMEKADNLDVMPLSARWSDLGGWASVWQESVPDAAGNVLAGPSTALDCTGSLLRADGENVHLVGIGLKDMIAVATPDAVLVAPMSESQRVGEAVAALKAKAAPQAETSPRDHRPWGWFESLAAGERFQVKRIFVKPGASLSLQSHNHRAEHWIVVAGTAHVTIGDTVQIVTENQSVYVPLGERHRLENRGKLPVILIEVQTGAYLGEDDIIRYQDAYSRT
ncbi:MAG: mannose-1-phosphate guanylyltransferase/mannose-6-phosphate isomerase [Chakrabartia sp.]